MLVVDPSVLVPLLVDHHDLGPRARRRLRGERLAGPDLVKIETLSVLRRLALSGRLGSVGVDEAVDVLSTLPMALYPTDQFVRRAWQLRHGMTAYDACYVSLAEALAVPLLTADARLAGTHGHACEIEVV